MRPMSLVGAGLVTGAVLLTGCSSTGTSASDASPTSSQVEGAVPVEVDPGASPSEGQLPTLDVAEAVGEVKCDKPTYGSVECTVPITNTTDQMGQLSTEMAMLNSDGVRLESDGRYQEYVAPGETYLAHHYGPKRTTSGQVLSVEFDEAMNTVSGQPVKEGGSWYLPTDSAKVGKCRVAYGDSVCRLTITNTGPVLGEIDTQVAFYNAANVRVDSETRFEEKLAPGMTYRQNFYGPRDTAAVKILSIELEPDES